MTHISKRKLLKGMLTATAAISMWRCTGGYSTGSGQTANANNNPLGNNDISQLDSLWAQADLIEQQIKRTAFPNQLFRIDDFSAQAGTAAASSDRAFEQAKHNRQAIQRCIDHCHQSGGGRVLIPQGIWYSGALTLKSNVELHLVAGAILQFHPAPELYLPLVYTRWEGMELMGYQPLIYAYQAENIAVTGQGLIHGGGSNQHWWPWKGVWKHTPWPVDTVINQQEGRDRLIQWIEEDKPLAERVLTPNYLRPPLIQPHACKRVLIEGVTLTNSPFWIIHPVVCEDVIVRGVKCNSHGPNSDGCNPESSKRVLIEHCEFDTGDDCIALKSGRNRDGRRINKPVEQVLIQHCTMKAGHGGVVLGSEISGGARQIFARDLVMSSPHLDRGLRIKTNAARGGLIDTVALRDIVIGQVKDAIVINYFYEEGTAGTHMPTVRNIFVHNMQVKQAERVFELLGFPQAQIGPLQLSKMVVNAKSLGELQDIAELQTEGVVINGEPWHFQSGKDKTQ